MSSALRALKQKQVAALETADMASMFSVDTGDQHTAAESKRAMLFPEAHPGLSVGVSDHSVENFPLSEIDDPNFGGLEPEAIVDLPLPDEGTSRPQLWLAQGPLDDASILFREACHAFLRLAALLLRTRAQSTRPSPNHIAGHSLAHVRIVLQLITSPKMWILK
jgi:hypothetical protein